MFASNTTEAIATPSGLAGLVALTEAEARNIGGGKRGVGLIIDFFKNGEKSKLHKAGTWLGETAAKGYIAIFGL